MADQDTEITLGAGKLMGLFFGLVVLCGVFFVMGYSLGHSTAPGSTTLTAEPTAPGAVATTTEGKPAATQGVVPKPDCASTPEGCAAAADDARTTAPDSSTPGPPANSAMAAPASAEPKLLPAAPEVRDSASTGYVVQVAAVSKQQDAENLVSALKRKQYPVFVATQASDTLFHVQLGPFSDAKEAEAIRSRLVADGYNPILKK